MLDYRNPLHVHVLIGTIFLTVGLFRVIAYHLTDHHHLGLEAAILYWHIIPIITLYARTPLILKAIRKY
jgi:heme/copper-type cytochrome/quinol oxidase subunit 3